MDVDYFYLNETPKLFYRVDVKPAPADTSKAEFHKLTPDGAVLHTQSDMKKEGEGTFDFPVKPRGAKLEDSPLFVEFIFAKGDQERRNFTVISLAEPQVRSIWAPPEAYPKESVKLEVIAWDAKTYDQPGSPTQFEERNPTRVIDEHRKAVKWSLEGEELPDKGESIKTDKIKDEHLGKWVTVIAWLGDQPVDPNATAVTPPRTSNRLTRSRLKRSSAEPAKAKIAVPQLEILGPKVIELGKQVTLDGAISPTIDGVYEWTAGPSKTPLGVGTSIQVQGLELSPNKEDVLVECAFTSSATRRVYRAEHKMTVVEPSQQAKALEKAAEDGTPVCEVCEKQAAEAAEQEQGAGAPAGAGAAP